MVQGIFGGQGYGIRSAPSIAQLEEKAAAIAKGHTGQLLRCGEA